jgi:regulator of protease activity HflC (stomatin/prohibitin superfamily)
MLGMIPGLVMLWLAWQVAGRFVYALYGLGGPAEGRRYLSTRLVGQMSGGPYLVVKEGKVTFGTNAVKKIGGPGAVVLYNDSAVVLEQAGRLTQVKRGPVFQQLKPFERVWDIINVLPQRWEFDVTAITQDGIPITYPADIHFQIGDTDEDIFKAATSKWIRDAWRTEPDRLMTWIRLVIISQTEGALRSILARCTLDQLIKPEQREVVRQELETNLTNWAPTVGARILMVNLGDIQLKGQILQQWIAAWQSERDSAIQITLADGQAQRTKLTEDARIDVQISQLDHTTRILDEMAAHGINLAHFVLLDLVDRIQRLSYDRSLYLPDGVINTLVALRQIL